MDLTQVILVDQQDNPTGSCEKLEAHQKGYEFDHVFVGEYSGAINFNKEEVMDYCYKTVQAIGLSLQSHPQKYTAWFHLAFPKIENWWKKHFNNQTT